MGSTSTTYPSSCDSSLFITEWSRGCGGGGYADRVVDDLLGVLPEAVALSTLTDALVLAEAVSAMDDFVGDNLSGLLMC